MSKQRRQISLGANSLAQIDALFPATFKIVGSSEVREYPMSVFANSPFGQNAVRDTHQLYIDYTQLERMCETTRSSRKDELEEKRRQLGDQLIVRLEQSTQT